MTTSAEQRLTTPLWITVLLCLFGLAASGFALYEHVAYTNGLATGPSVCQISAYIDCTKVNTSEWSKFFGLPLGAYGIVFYGILLAASLASLLLGTVSHRDALAFSLLSSAAASTLSVALFAISHFIIGALCIVCVSLYVTNFILFGVAARGAWRGRVREGLSEGVSAIGAFFATTVLLMPARSVNGAMVARIGLVLAVAGMWAASQLPQWLLISLGGQAAGSGNAMVKEAVARWRDAPLNPPVVIDEPAGNADLREGSREAPVSIVEFADFECPGCRRMYPVLHDVLKEHEGQYTFVFKNYPLDSDCNPFITRQFHLNACNAALLTRCAAEQGKLKEAVDFLFTDKTIENREGRPGPEVRDAMVAACATQLGLDGAALRECVVSRRHLKRVQEDINEGQRLGLDSTPSLWVNGRPLKGANPDVLRAVFSDALAPKRR